MPRPSLFADTYTWSNAGTDFSASGDWNDTTTGTMTGAPSTTTDIASFTTAAATDPVLSQSVSIASITFGTAGIGYDITNSAGSNTSGFTLTLNATGTTATTSAIYAANTGATSNIIDAPVILGAASGSQTIYQAGGTSGTSLTTLTINGLVSATSAGVGITKAGGGVLVLSNANTYTGATNITSGDVSTANLAAGGTASGIGESSNAAANLVLNGGTLQYTGSGATTDRGFTLSGSGGLDSSGTGALVFSNTATPAYGTTNATRMLTLTGSNTAANTLDAVLTDNGTGAISVAKSGAGTWVLGSSANTYSGVTTLGGGILSTASLANGGTASGIGESSNAAANLVFNGGTLQYTGSGVSTDRSFTMTNNGTIDSSGTGALVFSSTVTPAFGTANAARTLTLTGSNANSNTLDADITNNGTGTLSITKSGTGTWVLPNANSYSGTTSINAGTLVIGNVGSLGGSTVSLATGTLSASSAFSSDLTNSFTLSGNSTIGGSNNIGISGTFTNSGTNHSLTVANAGTTVTLDGGVYISNITTSGYTLIFAGAGNETINGAIANVAGAAGTAGNVTYDGTGVATITGNNTYTGTTTFGDKNFTNVGQVNINSNTALGTGPLTIYQANFDNTSGKAVTESTIGSVTLPSGSQTLSYTFLGSNNLTLGASGGSVLYNTYPLAIVLGGASTLTLPGILQPTEAYANTFTVNNSATASTSTPPLLVLGGIQLTETGVTSSSTFTLTGSANVNVSGPITDGGGASNLTYKGTGTLTLNGTSTYSGTTLIQSGTVLANGGGTAGTALGASTVTVNTGGTLGGTGRIGGTGITIGGTGASTAGATITGGTVGTVGTLTLVTNVTLTGSSTAGTALDYVDLGNSSTDKLAITGNLTLPTGAASTYAALLFNQDTGTSLAPGTYPLITYTGTLTGSFGTVTGLPTGDSLVYNTGAIDLVVGAVPEPQTWMMMSVLMSLLGIRYTYRRVRRKRRLV